MRRPRIARRPERDASVADRLHVELGVVDVLSGTVVGDVFSPLGGRHDSVIVTLHGLGGRREDLTQFAIGLADRGAVVCNASWWSRDAGLGVDDAVRNIQRAVAFAMRRWNCPVTLVGWSDGAFAAAAAALDVSSASDATPTTFVGFGGYYGWANHDVAAEKWSTVNPYRAIERRGTVEAGVATDFHLVVGEHDLTGPDARGFGDALHSAGFGAQVHVVEGCDVYGLVVPRHAPGAAASDLVIDLASQRTRR